VPRALKRKNPGPSAIFPLRRLLQAARQTDGNKAAMAAAGSYAFKEFTMALYLNGLKPTAYAGTVWQSGLFFWMSLATLCDHFAPNVTARWNRWTSISGNEVGPNSALTLARTLRACHVRGEIDQYLAAMPKHADRFHLTLDDVLGFIEFLETSGGFRIGSRRPYQLLKAARKKWPDPKLVALGLN